MTVDSADYVAFLAAWGSNLGDAKYNAQADVNDDETVDSADYALFIAHMGQDSCWSCDEAYRFASRRKRECRILAESG